VNLSSVLFFIVHRIRLQTLFSIFKASGALRMRFTAAQRSVLSLFAHLLWNCDVTLASFVSSSSTVSSVKSVQRFTSDVALFVTTQQPMPCEAAQRSTLLVFRKRDSV